MCFRCGKVRSIRQKDARHEERHASGFAIDNYPVKLLVIGFDG